MSEEPKISSFGKLNTEFSFSILKTVLRKQWYIIPLLLISGLIIGFVYLRYTKPKFQSSAVIQRSSQDEGKRVLDIESFQNENSLPEDVEVLKSKFLLEKALRNLNLNTSYFSEGDLLTEEKYLFSSYHITLRELRDSSLIGKRINLINESGKLFLELGALSTKERIKIPIKPNESVSNKYFDLSLKISKEELFQATSQENKLYFIFNDYSSITDKLHPQLSVYTLNGEARTIKISFQSNNQLLAKDVVSSVINTFFKYDLEKKSKSSANILDFIDTQLDTVFLALKESEIQIQSFKDSSKVNDPSMFAQRILSEVTDLNKSLLLNDVEIQLLLDIETSVQSSDRIEIYNLIPTISGTGFENLLSLQLTELYSSLEDKEDISYSFTTTSDETKRIEKRIVSQTENIKRTIDSFKKRLLFKKGNFQDRIYALESKLYGVPAKEMELSRLNRMFNLNEKYYTLLVEKKTEYAISKAGYTMDNMILQSPTAAVLIAPKSRFVYSILIVLSTLIGIIFILIKYLTFSEFHSEQDIKNALPAEINFLGGVPKTKSSKNVSTLIINNDPKSILAESLRHIRSNLQFILKQDKSNLIAVTSSVSGEGKTFVVLNLAGILTLSGKKVIVIDLDLRKPKIHLGLNAENSKGMSNVLAGHISWREVKQTSSMSNLDFITAGPVPPNPSELILSNNFKTLLEELKKEYDVIIVDNPPVGIVSDGLSVIAQADCPIYVFRANYSKRFFMGRLTELKENQNLDNLNVILNGVNYSKSKYGYGYGYGYGQYYGEEEPKRKFRFLRKK